MIKLFIPDFAFLLHLKELFQTELQIFIQYYMYRYFDSTMEIGGYD